MTSYGYARISTEMQILDHQIDLLEEAGVDPQNIYVDIISGKECTRTGIDTLWALLGNGDSVTVTRLSRLGRSTIDLLNRSADMKARGVDLVVLQQQIDTRSPLGRLVFTIMAAVDEFQRELIADNVVDGVASAKKRGEIMGRRPAISREEHPVMHQMRTDGATIRDIAAAFRIGIATAHAYLDKPVGDAELEFRWQQDEFYEKNGPAAERRRRILDGEPDVPRPRPRPEKF